MTAQHIAHIIAYILNRMTEQHMSHLVAYFLITLIAQHTVAFTVRNILAQYS